MHAAVAEKKGDARGCSFLVEDVGVVERLGGVAEGEDGGENAKKWNVREEEGASG